MAKPLDICIRGAGITGRTLALLLARERLQVGLVSGPRSASAAAPVAAPADVRAYALNLASRKLLQSLRCWPDASEATPVLAMQVQGDAGGEVNFRAQDQGVDALAWIVDVGTLERRLADAAGFQPQIELIDSPQPAALTVVCEGRASSTRAEFGVGFDVMPYGQHAVAARLVCSQPHQQTARQWFTDGEILGVLPLDGALGNSVAIVWSVSEERARSLQDCTAEAFAQQLQAASHGRLGELTLCSERPAWPLQLALADRWVGSSAHGAWALAGDAAHNVHPLSGQGLNLGLADVATLARVLHERDYWRGVNDEKTLRRYERSRKADVLATGATTDGLQRLFSHNGNLWRSLRNYGMNGFEHSGPLKSWIAKRAMGAL